jgi:serine/threonine protein kinase
MSTLKPDQIFERYRIIQWLGSGVSGESYEAEDTMLLRKVTLKLIHPKSTLPDAARRQFFREMQGISILNHLYLASVLDYGEIDGKLYVARRYVGNGSLLGNNGRLWFRIPLDISDAIQYGLQLAQALQYIHNRGYLHGALTFSNILVLRGPNLEHETNYAPFLLADAGLTNFVRRSGENGGMPLPITAAPEQLGKRVIPASDQYALAVVLYFWLVGRLPYVGSPEEIEHLKLTETITPPSSVNPRITIEQDGVLLRALSVSPEDRYPSVQAFMNALQATLLPEPQPVLKTELTPQTVPTIESDSKPTSQPLTHLSLEVQQPSPEQDVTQPTLHAILQPQPDIYIPSPEPDVAEQATDAILLPMPSLPPALTEINAPIPAPGISPQAKLSPIEQLPGTQEHLSEMRNEHAAITARLIINSPYTEEPYEVELQGDETTIGRAGSSDILLDRDDLTSRHHALLRCENNRYVLYDRRSANGVQVNGQRLQSDSGFELEDGDHISIGNYELIFRFRTSDATDEVERSFATQNSTIVWGA